MTTSGISNTGSVNFERREINNPENQQAEVRQESAAQTAQESTPDSVTIGESKSTLRKIGEAIIDFPVKVLEVGLSATFGTAYAAKNVLPGAVKGISEGLADDKGYGSHKLFDLVSIGEMTAAGAVAGFTMGGPVSSLIGAGVGFVSGLLVKGIESMTKADDKLVKAIEENVDKAVADNKEGTPIQIATRSATEGLIEGTLTGVTVGWQLGASFGKGVASGLRGAADGAKEAFFGK